MATLAELQSFANYSASSFGLNPTAYSWLVNQESGWNPNATNGNAVGINQFMPGTASDMGLVDRTDPWSSLWSGAQYLSQLLKGSCNGDYQCAMTKYGTLQNVPASVTQSFNNMAAATGINVGGNAYTSNSYVDPMGNVAFGNPVTQTSQTDGAKSAVDDLEEWLAGSAVRVVVAILGLLLIVGAIYIYGK